MDPLVEDLTLLTLIHMSADSKSAGGAYLGIVKLLLECATDVPVVNDEDETPVPSIAAGRKSGCCRVTLEHSAGGARSEILLSFKYDV